MKPQGFEKLTSSEEALDKWFETLKIVKPKTEEVTLQDALGRVLAEDLVTTEALPRFDKSAMDGYAVSSADLKGASESQPVTLMVTKKPQVIAGQVYQIWTGNPIPKGADTVVMIEDTQQRDGEIEVYVQLSAGKNVVKAGEDVKKGTVVALAGTRLNAYHLGLAAALGLTKLVVSKKPKIAIIATGNEIAQPGSKRTDFQIYDSNQTIFSALCRGIGAEAKELGIVKDEVEEIAARIETALKDNDAVFTTGGTSVGGLDLVPDVVNKLGNPGVIVHGVKLRPGMPAAVAVLSGKPVLVLSGNPVAAIVAFEAFGRPLICRMLGMSKTEPLPMLKATMSRDVATVLDRKTYVRVRVALKDGEFIAEPVSTKGSGAISTMTQSNGYVVVPENREELSKGETVLVNMFADLEGA